MTVVYFVEDNRPKTGDPVTVIDNIIGSGVGTGVVGARENNGFWVAADFYVDGQHDRHTVWCWYGTEGIDWARGHTGEVVEAFLVANALR